MAIWPVYALLNELPFFLRLCNPILCGVWVGPQKPTSMRDFLFPILEEIAPLGNEGLQWSTNDGQHFISRLFVFPITADSPAKACLLEVCKCLINDLNVRLNIKCLLNRDAAI